MLNLIKDVEQIVWRCLSQQCQALKECSFAKWIGSVIAIGTKKASIVQVRRANFSLGQDAKPIALLPRILSCRAETPFQLAEPGSVFFAEFDLNQ